MWSEQHTGETLKVETEISKFQAEELQGAKHEEIHEEHLQKSEILHEPGLQTKPHTLSAKQQLVNYMQNLNIHNFADFLFFRDYKKLMEFEKFKHIFDPKNRVVIVGNGPVEEKLGNWIDTFDVVVRFNKYTKDVEHVGSKLDIHIVNINGHNQSVEDIIEPDVLTLFLECLVFEHNYNIDIKDCFSIRGNIFEDMCAISDSTRGFYGVLLLTKVFKNIQLVGFGGIGHHNQKLQPIAHNITAEHKILRDLCKENLKCVYIKQSIGLEQMICILAIIATIGVVIIATHKF